MSKKVRGFLVDGPRVRELRRQSDYPTQEKFAKHCGCSRATIGKAESGGPVDKASIQAIAEVFDMPWRQLVIEEGPAAGSTTGQPESAGTPAAPSHLADGLDPSITKHIIDFSVFIGDRTSDFVGRKALFDQVDMFLKDSIRRSGYLVVEGKPGMGKSAFLAALVSQRDHQIHHFNIAASGINTPAHFLANICARMIRTYDLPYGQMPEGFATGGAFLSQILLDVSKRATASHPLVVVVDALDEAIHPSSHQPSNPLFLPSTLPQGVFFIVSTRDVKTVHLRVDALEVIPLTLERNLQDITQFLEKQATRAALRDWYTSQGLNTPAFVDAMAEKSEGNFMYLHYILPELEGGHYKDLAFADLPRGLENYYEDHWNRMSGASKPPSRSWIQVLYVLSAAQIPITASLLADFAETSLVETQSVLDAWRQFLDISMTGGRPHYSFYHASFRDFLYRRDNVQAAGIDLGLINDKLGTTLLDEFMKDA